ncbi:MAG: sigma-70 family RNA polymerase sigma factor [Planctomycetes bacterium]|nr:sigma-70 family RNA polymerase sigma factor [Planctomycetota bacterium]
MDTTEFQVQDARDGGGESLNRLYERLAPALFAWARLRLRSAPGGYGPEDLMQEVWLRALAAFDRFEARGAGSFRAWMFRIASNVYLEVMRRRGSSGPTPEHESEGLSQVPAEITSITAGLRRSESIDRLVERINSLEQEDRRLFIHRGLEGKTAAETAEILGLGEEAVHKRWQRLRTKLRDDPVFIDLVDQSDPRGGR